MLRACDRDGCLIISDVCNSKVKRLMLLATLGTAAYALFGRRRKPAVSMHELDWWDGEGDSTLRRYKNPGHLFHHLKELAGLAVPLSKVYVLRALPPSFREQIMIVTAMANECPQ
jgi:hypothetical protein